MSEKNDSWWADIHSNAWWDQKVKDPAVKMVKERIVMMPDPKEDHEYPLGRLKSWELLWLVENHGGMWCVGPGSPRVTFDHPAPQIESNKKLLSWRPTLAPDTRRENLTLEEVFAAKPDGENSWATHPTKVGWRYLVPGPGRGLRHWDPVSTGTPVWHISAIDENMLTGWTLWTRATERGKV